MFHAPDKYRILTGPLGSDPGSINNGAFEITMKRNEKAFVIASDGFAWEHVSVHMIKKGRAATPTWDEMCRIKDLFWDGEDCVIEYHPPKSRYVNNHKNCLHLWRPMGRDIPLPPTFLTGIKRQSTNKNA